MRHFDHWIILLGYLSTKSSVHSEQTRTNKAYSGHFDTFRKVCQTEEHLFKVESSETTSKLIVQHLRN